MHEETQLHNIIPYKTVSHVAFPKLAQTHLPTIIYVPLVAPYSHLRVKKQKRGNGMCHSKLPDIKDKISLT
jgi:hypothetical protein